MAGNIDIVEDKGQDVVSGLSLHVPINKKNTQEASIILLVILYFIFQVHLTKMQLKRAY